MQPTAEHLLDALGIQAEPGGETYSTLVDDNPTIQAFLDEEISFAEAVFIETYLANGFNHKKAAQSARYRAATAGGYTQVGSALLRKPKIRDLLADRVRATAMEADEVLARYREVAESSLEDFIKVEDGMPVIDMTEAQDKLHLLKEIKLGKDGEVNIKIRDRDHALDQLARSAGAFERDHTINLPPELLAMLQMTPDQRAAREKAYDSMEEWDDDDGGTQEETGGTDSAS